VIEDFIYSKENKQRELLLYLHNLLTESFGLQPKIRYKIPFYYNRSWICYLNPIKNDEIELAFTRGNELSNVQGILESKGRSQVLGMEFYSVHEIPENEIMEVVQEAIILDENVPYASKRKKILFQKNTYLCAPFENWYQ